MGTQKISATVQDSTAQMAQDYVKDAGGNFSKFVDQAIREKLSRDGARIAADWTRNTDEGRQVHEDMMAAARRSWADADRQQAA